MQFSNKPFFNLSLQSPLHLTQLLFISLSRQHLSVTICNNFSFDWQIASRFKRTFLLSALTHIFIWFPSRDISVCRFFCGQKVEVWQIFCIHSQQVKKSRNRIYFILLHLSHHVIRFVLRISFTFLSVSEKLKVFCIRRNVRKAGRGTKNGKIHFTFDMIVCRRARLWKSEICAQFSGDVIGEYGGERYIMIIAIMLSNYKFLALFFPRAPFHPWWW